ncbi:hypothetical protein [Candidatus Symbiopectobacterium sp. NZEC135]|nr:hypothetical protein [Candidatus Symbiopectobacterium sp. NZEC135]MCW2479669.1 hypothetical protein [Candidatus Symbiopectobacterium sp. NZEC135]
MMKNDTAGYAAYPKTAYEITIELTREQCSRWGYFLVLLKVTFRNKKNF